MEDGAVDAVPDAWLAGPDRPTYARWPSDRLAWGGFATEAEEARRAG